MSDDVTLWLNGKGFSDNPFINLTADAERSVLSNYFVDVAGYDQIIGNKSVVAFAHRGAGKSALRVMLAQQTAPFIIDSEILGVEYTDFGGLLPKLESLTLQDHLDAMLKQSVQALIAFLCGNETSSSCFPFANSLQYTPQVDRADPAIREMIAAVCQYAYPELLQPHSLYRLFRQRATDFSQYAPSMSTFRTIVQEGKLTSFIEGHSTLKSDEVALFWASLTDSALYTSFPHHLSPTGQLDYLLEIVQGVGLNRIHFFVDRLDEMQETLNEPDRQVGLIAALISDLHVLEHKGVAVKFFLTQEAYTALHNQKLLRTDRVRREVVTVEWNDQQLTELLSERLSYFGGRLMADFNYFCNPASEGNPEESAEVLSALLKHASGSPRRLLVVLEGLCRAHIARVGMSPNKPITLEDWRLYVRGPKQDIAHQGMLKPILQLFLNQRQVRKGNLVVKLTKIEAEVLGAIAARMPEICYKNDIADRVWNGVMSDDTLARHISALRKKLGDGYIETVHGEGYLLRYAELM